MGEVITIKLKNVDDGHTEVTASSVPMEPFSSTGVNRRNIKKLFRYLQTQSIPAYKFSLLTNLVIYGLIAVVAVFGWNALVNLDDKDWVGTYQFFDEQARCGYNLDLKNIHTNKDSLFIDCSRDYWGFDPFILEFADIKSDYSGDYSTKHFYVNSSEISFPWNDPGPADQLVLLMTVVNRWENQLDATWAIDGPWGAKGSQVEFRKGAEIQKPTNLSDSDSDISMYLRESPYFNF